MKIFVAATLLLAFYCVKASAAPHLREKEHDQRALSKKPVKVDICHIPPGNPSNFRTINVSENAVQDHLDHGDLLGPCSENCGTLCRTSGDMCEIHDCEDKRCLGFVMMECDYGHDCTDDQCNPETGFCEYTPDNAKCDDEIECTTDVCNAASGCVHSPVHSHCDDGIGCTFDTCDVDSGCVYIDNCLAGKECDRNQPGSCVAPDPCLGKTCPAGESCDTADGHCKSNAVLRPCIAVIDESDSMTDATVDAIWANFRTKYPHRPFCLLQPQNPDTGYNRLYRPPAFNSDPKTTFAVVNRDTNNPNQASDWLTACGISGTTGIDFVALFIDISGSMILNTVQKSFAKFQADLGPLGLEYCDVHITVRKTGLLRSMPRWQTTIPVPDYAVLRKRKLHFMFTFCI